MAKAKTYSQVIGETVEHMRLEKGWTQEELAHEVGSSQSAIHRIEKGGQNVSLDTLIIPKFSTGPTQISRFNVSRAIAFQGNAGEGYSSGQAMNAIEEVVNEEAGAGFNIEWSGQSREEKKAASSTSQVLALALVNLGQCLLRFCLQFRQEFWERLFLNMFSQ